MRPFLLAVLALSLALPGLADEPGSSDASSSAPSAPDKPTVPDKPSSAHSQSGKTGTRLDELSTFRLLSFAAQDIKAKGKDQTGSPAAKNFFTTMAVAADKARQADKKRKGDGERFARREAPDAANEAAAQVEENDPAFHEVNMLAARIDNSAGDSSDAEQLATRDIRHDPDARDAYIERAAARVGLEHYGAAMVDADKAVAMNPQGADGYRARAMAEFGLHNYQQAGEDARRALALDPDDRTSFAIMKLVEGRVPKLDVDKLRARMAGDILGEYHGMLQNLNEVDERRQALASGALWPNAAAGGPAAAGPAGGPSPETASGPAAGAPAQAAQAAAGARALAQDAAGRLVGKDYTGAIEQADKALAKDPANLPAYFYRATADNLLGRYDDAERDATRALELNPSDAPSHDARAYALNHLGRYRDAIADSNHSLEIDPQNAYAYANLGYSHEQMGALLEMAQDLKTAATLNPQFEPAYRDAAARHGLPYEPLTDDGLAAEQAQRQAQDAARRKQFLFVIGSSVVGGLLIALGFLQLLGGGKPAAPAATRAGKTGLSAAPAPATSAYTIGKQIGLGGMGVVYEGFDKALHRKVAIKAVRDELKRDEDARRRFLSEARTVAALHHPGIVDIHAIVEDGADVYLVFEFVEGRTLADILAERGRLSLREAKAIVGQVCRALDFAHRRGVVHRDLKPANIMVAADGTVKLMDFGISRPADALAPGSTALQAESRTGTPDYMAPEQRFGAVRPESDVFSLGACLYEMTTGRRPFPAGQAIPAGQFTKASALQDDLPAALDVFFEAALHPDPERRIRSARDFWALLERVKEGAVASA